MHFKTSDASLYNYGMDGDKVLFNDESRAQGLKKHQQYANLSHKGLTFFSLMTSDYCLPAIMKEEFTDTELFYLPDLKWNAVPYY